MPPEVRLIDANALIKDISESIRLADEWEKESHEKKDRHGLKCATDTRRSLMAMLSRVKEFPTIEAAPKWIPCSERLPEMFEEVLVVWLSFKGDKHVTIAYMDDEENSCDWCSGWNGDVIDAEVTHWMPLPCV